MKYNDYVVEKLETLSIKLPDDISSNEMVDYIWDNSEDNTKVLLQAYGNYGTIFENSYIVLFNYENKTYEGFMLGYGSIAKNQDLYIFEIHDEMIDLKEALENPYVDNYFTNVVMDIYDMLYQELCMSLSVNEVFYGINPNLEYGILETEDGFEQYCFRKDKYGITFKERIMNFEAAAVMEYLDNHDFEMDLVNKNYIVKIIGPYTILTDEEYNILEISHFIDIIEDENRLLYECGFQKRGWNFSLLVNNHMRYIADFFKENKDELKKLNFYNPMYMFKDYNECDFGLILFNEDNGNEEPIVYNFNYENEFIKPLSECDDKFKNNELIQYYLDEHNYRNTKDMFIHQKQKEQGYI